MIEHYALLRLDTLDLFKFTQHDELCAYVGNCVLENIPFIAFRRDVGASHFAIVAQR